MAITYDIKWKNDLKMYMGTFKSFIIEGNINDLQPIELANGYDYVALDESIAQMYSKDYCVVFYDHTKQSGKRIESTENSAPVDEDNPEGDGNSSSAQTQPEQIDEKWFNSFTFYKTTIYSQSGDRIASPNIELFKEYYKPEYLDRIAESSTKDMQGGRTIDIRRMYDVMNEFEEKRKIAKYAEAKPFMFILPNVSRYMTVPGRPDDMENAILMILFSATQIANTSCKLMLCVDKINDLPTWFESESNNSAVKKLYIPTPDNKFRETFFKLEIRDIMDPISEDELESKIIKFSSYTENFSLRRLHQLKSFIETESEHLEEGTPSYKKIENIDKTVLRFESGQTTDPWRDPKLLASINEMGGKIERKIKGQRNAILSVVKALRTAAAGLKSLEKNDRSPRAVFFFAGPTGVGKTELSKQISETIFQKQDSMIRFDMSEFREEHTDARLFGAPPGYVGYEAGGELTKAVKQNPFSVILFDEMEKAHPRIWDKFLQILGDGRLTDGKGETVSFTQCIIIFTSNLGITADPISNVERVVRDKTIAENNVKIKELELKIEESQNPEERKGLVKELWNCYLAKGSLEGLTYNIHDEYLFTRCHQELEVSNTDDAFNKFISECVSLRIKEYFDRIGRREIYGRIGDSNVLVFNYMTPTIAQTLADKTMDDFIKALRYEHDRQINLEITENAKAFIRAEAQKSDVINLGGRGIIAAVKALINDPVGEFLVIPEYFGQTNLHIVMDVEYGKLFVELR